MSWQPWGFQSGLSSPSRAMGCCQQSQVCSTGEATLSSSFTTQGFLTALLEAGKRVSVSTPDTNVKWDCQPVALCVTSWKKMTLNVWKVFKKKVEVNNWPSSKWCVESIQGTGYLCCGLACETGLWLRMRWNDFLTSSFPLSPMFPVFAINNQTKAKC